MNDSNQKIKNSYYIEIEKIICENNDCVTSIDIFQSGNIISVSRDTSIIIWDNKLNILTKIKNAHNNYINDVKVINENNFITCSYQSIKIWVKINDQWKCNQLIENAHNSIIFKILYNSNNKIISCSEDETIKIWEEINNNYQLVTTLSNKGCICSILINENILISSGDNTIIWDFQNYIIKKKFEIECYSSNALQKIDNDRIIIGGGNDEFLIVISISENEIIQKIPSIQCMAICVLEKNKLFLVGGYCHDIAIYNTQNYELINIIKNTNLGSVYGFKEIRDGSITSYSCKNNIYLWKIKKKIFD